jgi:hypothetical protein
VKILSKTAGIAAGIALAAGSGLAVSDPVGKIIDLHGEVLLNNGQVVVPAEVGMPVQEHDQLYILQAGKASLAMAAGCNVELGADQIVTLTSDNQCDPRGAEDDILSKASASAGTDQGLAALESGARGQFDERQGVLGGALGGSASTAGLATLGVLGVGGVAWAVSDNNSNDDDNPVVAVEQQQPQASAEPLPISPF